MKPPISYQTPDDLRRVQVTLMQWTKQAGHCNYFHKGDIRHRLFNGGYQHQPQDILHYWLDDDDKIIGFVQLYPFWDNFELYVAPELRYTDFHIEAFQWAEENLIAYANRIEKPLKEIVVETFGCNPQHEEFVMAHGYIHDKHAITYTEHDYQNIPEASLPEGFRFHDATVDDFENLADVHNHSFTNKWTADIYGKVFTAPHQEYEIVVVAPDGRFAAFTQVWVDDINKTILFEPMGTHEEFRRQGIGKALMIYVLKRMQAEHGTQRAIVCHETPDKNPASGALYKSVGFRPKYQIHEYVKTLTIS
jgi:mycothiol synthase